MRRPLVLLAIVLAAGAWLRFDGGNWDAGAHEHPDERYLSLVENAIALPHSPAQYFDVDRSPLNPYRTDPGRSYLYGTLPLFVTKAVAVAVGRDDYGHLYLVGRRLSALLDALTIVAVLLLARRLLAERGRTAATRFALLAAAFYATAVVAIQHSHFFTVESWLTAGSAWTLLVAAGRRHARRPSSCSRRASRSWEILWVRVTHDALKLTTYGGERHRAGGRFVTDALLDCYGRHRIATSVLLRGAQGFGAAQHLRTDRLLTLSEDLPIVSVAVDRRERIEALSDEVRELQRHGLVTLERARLLNGTLRPADVPDVAKLTLYLGRGRRVRGVPVHVAVCEVLHRRGVAGATVLLGVDGTVQGDRRRAAFARRNADVPEMVISVGPGARMTRALPELADLLAQPLVTLERATICKRDGVLLERPEVSAAGSGMWCKLTVHSSEAAMVEGRPQHIELVRRLRAAGTAGATTLRGIWGYHGDHAPHGDRWRRLRRHVPVMTVVIDAPQRIGVAFDVIDALTRERGLVTSELVPVLVAGRLPEAVQEGA